MPAVVPSEDTGDDWDDDNAVILKGCCGCYGLKKVRPKIVRRTMAFAVANISTRVTWHKL